MELTTMKTRTSKLSSTHVRGFKLAALALGSSLVLAGCAGNPPTCLLYTSPSPRDS